ncbi:MAG: autotransporter outer membrane beta-barrel domain-containing protein [Brucellaceae bacterium]|jgi:outer membrane autotransporter protein|nr:autotransporter outer membrane beta-barrel domain-containing protein [Brucellaceae bacterium]
MAISVTRHQGATRYTLIRGKVRLHLLTSAAIAIIVVSSPSVAAANEWLGSVDNDFFKKENWDDLRGPLGAGSSVNNGHAVGVMDLTVRPRSSIAEEIGTVANENASLKLQILTDPDDIMNDVGLDFGENLRVGANGGQGLLQIALDGPAIVDMSPRSVEVGTGAGSVGTLNLIGTGKDTSSGPGTAFKIRNEYRDKTIEELLAMPSNGQECLVCSSVYHFNNDEGIFIGKDQGSGTLNIDKSAFTIGQRSNFIIGDGAGSQGVVNVLAGGKLNDFGYGHYSQNSMRIGNAGGQGILNVGAGAASSSGSAPVAIFSTGLDIGNGAGSRGEVNILAGGKAHSFLNKGVANGALDSDASAEEYADYRTRIGVDSGIGAVTVSGQNSVWYQSGFLDDSLMKWTANITTTAGYLYVGESGEGTLTIADGGVVRAGTAHWTYDEDSYYTYRKLTDHVADGTVFVGEKAGGSGTINIGGKVGEAPTAAGRLMAKTLEFGEGSGLVRFNHTSSDYVFDEFDAKYRDGPSRPSKLEIKGKGILEAAAGRTILQNDQLGFNGVLRSAGGILQVNSDISAAEAQVQLDGVLEGIGFVGNTKNAGIIAPGKTPDGAQGYLSSIGTLTVKGNYTGDNGVLSLDTVLGGDNSNTDRLVVTGDTSGQTKVIVKNIGGEGAQTINGIEVINVGGKSEGEFTLLGNYNFNGKQAVVGGAYAYQLYQGGVANPADGNWYLRSEPIPEKPLYQAGVPVYEVYPQFLLGLNGLPILQQRVGRRYWNNDGNRVVTEGADSIGSPYAEAGEAGSVIDHNGVWGRIEGSYSKVKPQTSTSNADYTFDSFRMQAGIDGVLTETEAGKLIGGITAHYVHGSARIRATYEGSNISETYGGGDISTDGYGFGGALSWYGENGFYAEGQAQATWYNSDLSSKLAGTSLTHGNKGFGYALSLEGGRRFALDQNWTITPQGQLIYSHVSFDSFDDVFGAHVRLDRAASLQGRMGLAVERQNSWQGADGLIARSNIYGVGNLYYEFLNGTKVETADVMFANRTERLWGGIGLGGSYNWSGDKYAIYGENSVNTSLSNFGDSYAYKGNVGFRMKW